MSNRLKLILAIAGVALIGIVVAIAVVRGRGDADRGETSSSTHVKIEVRARPPATLWMNGRKVGTTPLTLTVPRGTTPVELDARYQKKTRLGRDVELVEQIEVQKVVPDQDRVVDFTHMKPAP